MSTLPVTALSKDHRLAEALLEIGRALGSDEGPGPVFDRICAIAAGVMGTGTCSVYLISLHDPDFLVLQGTYGLSRAQELGVRGFPVGKGIPGWAAQEGRVIAIADARDHPRHADLDDTREETRFVSYLCTPLKIRGEMVGVLSARREETREWSQEEILFAGIVARQIALVVEKHRLMQEKLEAERLAAIGISLSEVAHYIKNVLGAMAGGGYFVEAGLEAGDLAKARKGWDLLARNQKKITQLVENMLSFSRKQRCELEEGDLNAVVEEVARMAQEIAGRKGVELSVRIDGLIPCLRIDAGALTDAILNLATNAMDAIPAGREDGRVSIASRLDLPNSQAVVTIQDNGSGIPEAAQAKLFQLFFTTKGRAGTGIGLAVTKKIIEEHGGTISFQTKEGEGTTFTIRLPL